MAIRRIVPNLLTDDPETSRAFYNGFLGLDMVMVMDWIVTFAAADAPAAQLSTITADATAPVVPHISIEVDDVDALYTRAVAAGYEIVHPLTDEPWGVRRFFVRDPHGAVLNILQHA